MLMKLSGHMPMLTFLILSQWRSMSGFLILTGQMSMLNFLPLMIKLRIESITILTLCMENLLQRQLQQGESQKFLGGEGQKMRFAILMW